MADKSSGSSGDEGHEPLHRQLWDAFHRSPAGRGYRRGTELELSHRAMAFAALASLTLVPLLIVVAAADPENGKGFAEWLGDGLGVSPSSQDELEDLFIPPQKLLETTTAFGIATLAVFGLTFGTVVQTGYEKVWELPAARWHTMWRHLFWLAALIGYLFVSAHAASRPVYGTGVAGMFVRGSIALVSAFLFFWWSQRVLLRGRIGWRALLPGTVCTVIGLAGLRAFSHLVFSPLIASNAVTYGPIGTLLVVQSWLTGVGVVVFGGALVGRVLYEERAWLARRFLPGRNG
jgi:membrane protein